jgi:hypothetical protein
MPVPCGTCSPSARPSWLETSASCLVWYFRPLRSVPSVMAYIMEVPVATLLRGIVLPDVANRIASFVPTGFVVDLLASRVEQWAVNIDQAGLAIESYLTMRVHPLAVDPRLWGLYANVINRFGWSTPDQHLQLQRFFLPMPMSQRSTLQMSASQDVHDRLQKLFLEVLLHLTAVYGRLVRDPAEGISPAWLKACDDDLKRLARTFWVILRVVRGMVVQ